MLKDEQNFFYTGAVDANPMKKWKESASTQYGLL